MLAFGVTAALAVTLNRPAPMHASLTTASQAQAAVTCAATGLAISLAPGGASVSGTARVEFTNTSSAVCTLEGYPEVAAYVGSARGDAQVGAIAARDRSAGTRRVVLRPGGAAHADLAIDLVLPAATCKPVTATGLRVTAPGESNPQYLHVRLTACLATGPAASGHLRVRAVQQGAGSNSGPATRSE